jgi:hypothetical protein
MKSFVLFNNKGGVGKTTLTFNMAHMLARNGSRTIVLDFDPQSNVTAIFLNEEHLEDIWSNDVGDGRTVAGCLDLVRRGRGELRDPELVAPADNLWLLPGSLFLSRFEQTLAEEWAKTGNAQNERALDVTCSLANLADRAADAAIQGKARRKHPLRLHDSSFHVPGFFPSTLSVVNSQDPCADAKKEKKLGPDTTLTQTGPLTCRAAMSGGLAIRQGTWRITFPTRALPATQPPQTVSKQRQENP